MPYIADVERRVLLANGIAVPKDKAELAYKIAVDVDDYYLDKSVSFTTLTDALTALESVHNELTRRFLNRYESHKAVENGDCFIHLTKQTREPNPDPPYDQESDTDDLRGLPVWNGSE